jgi:serine/threonine protein kinase/biopolymer transport protein ExbD
MPAAAPEGLCPVCLLKRGLETQTAGAAAANFTPPTPEELARYFPQLEILELLGRGGMGVVYKARQRELDRVVALKILPSASDRDPAFAERFTREARALARLSHPNIVAVYDFGQTSGLAYFVMEYVDGLNLRQLQAAARMIPAEALAIVPQICDALQTAHDQGIVHRDIKPENILIDKKGRVKIADFGIAKIIGADQRDMTLTAAGEMVGTPAYMAPEQIEHPRDVDHRADIYSLGVVFYQMLTGELPLGKFAPPSRKVTIDVRFDDVVLRALEKEPQLRYQQVHEVRTQVDTIAGSPRGAGTAAHDSPVPPAELVRVRRSLIAWSIPLALAATCAAEYVKTYVWTAGAIVFAAAAILMSTLIMNLATSGLRNYPRLRFGAQLINMEVVGILGVVTWLAWHSFELMTPWRICLLVIFGYMIVCGCLKLACLWPAGRGFWAPDANRNQPLGYTALYFAAFSGLIPTIFYWLAPWVMPWLSADDKEIAIWATLWTALAAVITGIGARKSWTGRYAMALGGINLTVWLMLFVAGLSAGYHTGNPEYLQQETNDLKPDGTIHFTATTLMQNQSSFPKDDDDFMASDFVHYDTMTDTLGLPLHFDTTRDNVVNRYHVYLNKPAPPGGNITVNMEGTMTDLIHPTGNPGEFEYHMDHSPGYSGITRRIETHRLPPGAELISKSPDDLKVMTAGDHIELFIDRRIPRGGDIDIRFVYKLHGSATADTAAASPGPSASLAAKNPITSDQVREYAAHFIAQKEAAYKVGLITQAELQEAKDQVDLLNARLNDDAATAAEIKALIAQRDRDALAAPISQTSSSPLRSTQVTEPSSGQLFLDIRSDGSFVFDHKPILIADLSARLKELAKNSPGQSVIIRSDPDTNYKAVSRFLELCRDAGLWNVAFASVPSGTAAPVAALSPAPPDSSAGQGRPQPNDLSNRPPLPATSSTP